jgi:AraC-like DNA-binding protein
MDAKDGSADLGAETWALVLKKEGTTLYMVDEHQHPVVVPANTVFLCRSRTARMRVTKGKHNSTIVLWKASSLPKLAASFEKSKRYMAAQSVFPLHANSMELLTKMVNEPNRNFELIMIGILYTTIGQIIMSKDDFDLCPIDHLFPESLQPLLQMVRKEPAKYWPVPEAANIVGYSGHHFSRVFKQYSGMKFQSFVERCRTAYAIELLITSKMSVDSIATKAGFGAPQALRDAFKEILGIMPSDLRGFNHK